MPCSIQNIVVSCDYRVPGIERIMLLDYNDFSGFKFNADGVYSNCLITDIFKSGAFVELDVSESAKYSASLQKGIYTHSIETFIPALYSTTLSNLHLASKKRYIVVFRTKGGNTFAFGYEAGAVVSYTNQTDETLGSLVTITAKSIYPLFQADKFAILA